MILRLIPLLVRGISRFPPRFFNDKRYFRAFNKEIGMHVTEERNLGGENGTINMQTPNRLHDDCAHRIMPVG